MSMEKPYTQHKCAILLGCGAPDYTHSYVHCTCSCGGEATACGSYPQQPHMFNHIPNMDVCVCLSLWYII